jgi:hypothetical protein
VDKRIPPRGVEGPHSTTANNEKSIEGGAESGAIVDNPKLGQVLQALTSLTDDEREMLAELLKKMR